MSTFALPPALRAGAERLTRSVPGGEMAQHAKRLSENYIRGHSSHSAVTGGADIAAYLTARLPATYAAVSAALEALDRRTLNFTPHSILDAGAGPGTASWASLTRWPEIESVAMVDENETMLTAARALCAEAEHPALRSAHVTRAPITAHDPEASADLVIAGYLFAELAQPVRALERLWHATRQALVLVEPGTPDGFRRINAARDFLLKAGARIAAPCPHENVCPIVPPDWCHFVQRLPRSRDHMHAKGARVPFEDEKFSYLAVVRGLPLAPPAPRILDRPAAAKPGIRFKLCKEDGIAEQLVLKREKTAFRQASRQNWGDTLDI